MQALPTLLSSSSRFVARSDLAAVAINKDLNKSDQDKHLSNESKGRDGETIRDYVPKDGVRWRWSRPNYARVNDMYFKNRTKKPGQGTPEEFVTKVMKNWEVDSHHVAMPEDWQTIDNTVYVTSINGGRKANAQYLADVGPYNFFLQDRSTAYHINQNPMAEEANAFWSNVFTEGFAWECLEVYSGPPKYVFKWRHFGKYTGTYVDKEGNKFKGDGRIFELFGTCVATLNADAKIQGVEVFYNPDDMIVPLTAPELLSEPVKKLAQEPLKQDCTVM